MKSSLAGNIVFVCDVPPLLRLAPLWKALKKDPGRCLLNPAAVGEASAARTTRPEPPGRGSCENPEPKNLEASTPSQTLNQFGSVGRVKEAFGNVELRTENSS